MRAVSAIFTFSVFAFNYLWWLLTGDGITLLAVGVQWLSNLFNGDQGNTSERGGLKDHEGRWAPDRYLFLLVFVVWQACRSPFSYYRINIQAWVVDEHAQKSGVRQETLIYGLHGVLSELGRGFMGSLFFLGLGTIGGLRTENCLERCGGEHAEKACLDECHNESVSSQPRSLGMYIVLCYALAAPFFELACASQIRMFPIVGERLLALYA